MFNRELAIQELVDNDIQMIFDLKKLTNDEEYIASILEYGFKGYTKYTNEELIKELTERDISHLFGDNDE